MNSLLPTTLAGSYAQPDWLIDRKKLAGRFPPKVRATTIAERIRRAARHVPVEKIVVAPDCGLKYLPRGVAFGKIMAMVEGAKIVRQELMGKAE